jgi:hypothetical protein
VVGVTRRPAKGATRRPPVERPGNGFGRAVRPRPTARWRDPAFLATFRSWDPAELLRAPSSTTTSSPRPDTAVGDATVSI